jgi:hypothetical protein
MMRVAVNNVLIRLSVVLFIAVLLANQALAKKGDDKPRTVDSGSFGVFVKGQRVATETFQIQQRADGSSVIAELKAEDQSGKATQKAELQMRPNGDLFRYAWREISPGKAQATVEPVDQFLIEHIIPNPPEKPQEHPFMMPASTLVLDDYFFSQRQILAWRYLAQSCGGTLTDQCKLAKVQFGVIVPQQQASATVSLEFAGREKVYVRGVERELSRLNLSTDGVEWAIYLDEELKIVRIFIPAASTEVVRD